MKHPATALLPLLLTVLAGCATSVTPNYDAKFGDAVREAKLKMTINPDAGNNPDQATGMDGKSAREAIANYQLTYKSPPPAVNVINIGGSLGGSK
jgi:hypothetical protein